MNKIIHADCLTTLRDMPDASVDAIVTDPPYGLSNTSPTQVAETITRWVSGDREYLPTGRGFMGKDWDSFVPPVAVWDECLRVLKPGGHLLAFAGSRTHDLMTLGIRLAGFDIRDSVAWLYGSGFPKSMDVSKAIDKAQGIKGGRGPMKRGGERLLNQTTDGARKGNGTWGDESGRDAYTYAPGGDDAKRWQGWGTALKPAFEPVTLARKPLTGTVAANVQEHGTGALNIDGCRIGEGGQLAWSRPRDMGYHGGSNDGTPVIATKATAGRWPANVVLDESQAAELDRQSGVLHARGNTSPTKRGETFGGGPGGPEWKPFAGESGGASRFYYVAKAPKSERPVVDGTAHPTVKPLTLMRWLVRMVTPPGGTVLDPFAGSGTTLEAAMLEGFNVIGVEREADYLPLIQTRMDRVAATPTEG